MRMSTLITLLLLSLVEPLTTFPIHDPKDDVMINPTLDQRDKPACGMFKPTTTGRVYNGQESYLGQFPWAVCMIEPSGSWRLRGDGFDNLEDNLNNYNIWSHGPYEFSSIKAEVVIFKVTHWMQFCTGSIIDEHWILTAGHCFSKFWESNYFYVNAGTTECLNNGTDLTRLVVVNRLSSQYKTIFEHQNWLFNQETEYDIALLRINDGYTLPVDTYNNEPINRVCLYSFIDLPKEGCLKNVYFSGFGMKSDLINDPKDKTSSLTWFLTTRVSTSFCLKHGMKKPLNHRETYCYSPVLGHGDLDDDSSKVKGSIKNRTEAEMYPNTCSGDSGGPFVYYMKFNDKNNGTALKPAYRALLISTLIGSTWRKGDQYGCENNVYEGRDILFDLFYINRPVYYRTLELGPRIYTKIGKSWDINALKFDHMGQEFVKGNFVKYPEIGKGIKMK